MRSPTSTSRADDVLEKHAGGLLSPPASLGRLRELGDFGETTFDISGRGWDEAACDIVLPGLGWVSVTGSGRSVPACVGLAAPAAAARAFLFGSFAALCARGLLDRLP